MKVNMGTADRAIRVVLALVFFALYGMKIVTGTFGIVLAALGVIFLATSLIRFCPLYLPFGLNTCAKN